MDAYYDAGGRFIDTANNYSMWHPGGVGTESETVLGKWMQARGNRDQLTIATKVGFNRADTGPSLTRKTIRAELEGSLRRLGTDCVDLYYAHADIRSDPLDQTLAAFEEARRRGHVVALGCSNYLGVAHRAGAAAQQDARLGGVLLRAAALHLSAATARAPVLARSAAATTICSTTAARTPTSACWRTARCWRARTRGLIARCSVQYAGRDADERLAALREVAAETGATVNQVIYAWLLAQEPAIIPLTAPTTLAQFEENIKGLDVVLSEEQVKRLNTAGNPN